MYEELKAELDSGRLVHFGAGQQIPAEWIARAEERLGMKFPPSYRWWLETYGSGNFGVNSVLTILQMDFEEACGPDIVFHHENMVANGTTIENGLIVYEPESSDEIFYFDLSSPSESGEYPVMRWDMETGATEQYAPSFDQFMLKQIRQGWFRGPLGQRQRQGL